MPKIHLNYADDPLEYYTDQRRTERRTSGDRGGEEWRAGALLHATDRRVSGRRRNDPKSLSRR